MIMILHSNRKDYSRMSPASKNSFGTRGTLQVDGKNYEIFQIKRAGEKRRRPCWQASLLAPRAARKPFAPGRWPLRSRRQISRRWRAGIRRPRRRQEISFMPARVLLQDFTGVPAIVDLAAMREAIRQLGGDPKKVNPLLPAELVIDHSVQVDQVRLRHGLRVQCRARIPSQRRALRLPALGANGLRQFQSRAARYGHLPPGEPGISGARCV